jgi:protein-L-isoaspartate O-methyltransferase
MCWTGRLDWQKFWNEHPASAGDTDFLVQVGHTMGGKPYSEAQFTAMLQSIRAGLDLGTSDTLLDICCGNGVVTRQLAKNCHHVVGIDFSATLIDRAMRYNADANVTYQVMNALDVGSASFPGNAPFSRISMYAALQHFEIDELARLLAGMLAQSAGAAVIFIGGILDATRKHAFLDTPEKRALCEDYQRRGNDRLGTWWDPEAFANTCGRLGLSCAIDAESPGRPGGHYRFDARITR